MRDSYAINFNLLNDYHKELAKENINFVFNSHQSLKNSYLYNVSDLAILAMRSKIETYFTNIENGYKNIGTWLNSYIEDSSNLEKSLVNGRITGIKDLPTIMRLTTFINLNKVTIDESPNITNKLLGNNLSFTNIFRVAASDVVSTVGAEDSYDSYNKLKDKYKIEVTKPLEVTNFDDMMDVDNDFSSTTTGINGERIKYDHKDYLGKDRKGREIYTYYDENGNVVKRQTYDGYVEIGGKTIYGNGHIRNAMGDTLMEDGSYRSSDNTSVRYKDGTRVKYDETGNIKSITRGNETITYKDDYIESSKELENHEYEVKKYYKEGNMSETKTENGTNKTIEYDDKGNKTGEEKVYKTNIDGYTHVIKESGNTKTVYNGDGNRVEYIEVTDGNKTVRTHYYSDGSEGKVETIVNGEVVETKSPIHGGGYDVTDKNGNSTVYDDSGNVKRVENSSGTKSEYYSNGQLKSESLADGTYKAYDENGKLTYEKFKDGSSNSYYQDGGGETIDSNGNRVREFDKNGNTTYEVFPDGSTRRVYEDGSEIYSDASGKGIKKINADGSVYYYQ